MPDASGGIASGLYWVATGKMPLDELPPEGKPNGKDNEKDDQKDKRGKR